MPRSGTALAFSTGVSGLRNHVTRALVAVAIVSVSETSTIPNAGLVAACVRRVTAPMPLATIAHAHDRYLVVYSIDW